MIHYLLNYIDSNGRLLILSCLCLWYRWVLHRDRRVSGNGPSREFLDAGNRR